MVSSVDYVANNSRTSNASASQSLLASLSALTATWLLPATSAATQAVEIVSTASLSHNSTITRSNQQIASKRLASSSLKKAGQRTRIRNTLSCQVCGKKYTSLSPSSSLQYHEAVTGHLQSWTKERGFTWDDLKAWAEQKASRGNLARQRRRRQNAADKHGEGMQREGFMNKFSSVGPDPGASQSQAPPALQSRKAPDTTENAGNAIQVLNPDKPASLPIPSFYQSANREACSKADSAGNTNAMVQRHMDSDRDCIMRPSTKPDRAPCLRRTGRQDIPTIQAQGQAKDLISSSQTVDVVKAKSICRGAAQSNISLTKSTVTNGALSESAECTKCGRAFSGSRAKAHLSRHRNKLRHCNRYKAHMSVSNPSPAHTRPTKVTTTRPSQRPRKRSTGSLHSSDGESDISEGVWVSAVPANARPRTPDTTYSASENGRHRLAIASDPDAVLFPPEILAKNDRREKKNKRKRMQDWVSSYSATTEDDASQATSAQRQGDSTSLDLQSISEPIVKPPEPFLGQNLNVGGSSDMNHKKRREEGDIATGQIANGFEDVQVTSAASDAYALPSQRKAETLWKSADFDEIATVCFKHQVRYATPWPENMLEEHFVMLPYTEAELPTAQTSEVLDSEVQLKQRSWISSVTESVWNTLKRNGLRLSPQKPAA